MKKSILAIAALALLSACNIPSKGETRYYEDPSEMVIWIDKPTGCQYIVNYTYGGITPRITSEGKPICKIKGSPRG